MRWALALAKVLGRPVAHNDSRMALPHRSRPLDCPTNARLAAWGLVGRGAVSAAARSGALIAALLLVLLGCGEDAVTGADTAESADASAKDLTSSIDGAATDAAVTIGCPPKFAGCSGSRRWICDDQGQGFVEAPCAADLYCDEGACVACNAAHPCGADLACVAGKCVAQPLEILTKSLPAALVGKPYAQALQAQGGVKPYAFKVSQGALPSGVSLGTDGVFAGSAAAAGAFSFAVQVQDAAQTQKEQILTLEVKDGGLVITTTSPLKPATEGEPYQLALAAQGGTPPYFWGIVGGKLPAGVGLSSDGVLQGTPSGDATATFDVKVFDNSPSPLTATKTLELPIKLAPLEIIGSQELNLLITKIIVLPLIIVVDKVPVPYSAKLEAKGGKKPYSWSETALPGAVKGFLPKAGLPQGLKLAADGSISGSVTDASLVFELKVPLSQLVLKGFFFAAQVSDSQAKPQSKTALFIIPTVPVGG